MSSVSVNINCMFCLNKFQSKTFPRLIVIEFLRSRLRFRFAKIVEIILNKNRNPRFVALFDSEKGELFLKKSSSILCEGSKVDKYDFINKNASIYGLRWLLKRFNIYPNAYYNYLRNRKAKYYSRKNKIKNTIIHIYILGEILLQMN